MWRQIKLLTALELSNLYGMNVFRHTKDKRAKKKSILMMGIVGLVLLVLVGYVCGLCYGMVMLDATDIIPTYLIAISSIITLMLSVFKTGSIIFRRQGYEIISALPVSKWAIVSSRFIRLYAENLTITALIMVPGMIMYGIYVLPRVEFYLIGILSMLVTPLFPVALASGVGAVIVAISSRTKHKSLVEAALSVLLIVGVLFFTTNLPKNGDEISMEMLQNMENIVTTVIGKLYPPAVWLGESMVHKNLFMFCMTAGIFLLIFCVVIAVVSANFHKISRRLYGTFAKHNYEIENLQKNSIMKALVIREARRYFASGVYVTNTIIGPIISTAMSIMFNFIDLEGLTKSIPIAMNINAAVPFVVAAIMVMLNPASVSISMEGKEVWLLKSLPLDRRSILKSKILFNLYLCTPFYIVSVIALIIALRPNVWEFIGMIVIPVIVVVFAVILGVVVNLLLPKMQWENEVEVVKQSASAMLGGIGGTLIALVCAIVVLLVPMSYTSIVSVTVVVLLVAGATVMYNKNK